MSDAARTRLAVGLLFLATSLAMVSPSLLNGGAYAATDYVVNAAPLREDDPVQRDHRNGLQTDQFIQTGFPVEFWSALRGGDVQLWEPDIAGGVPLLTTTYTRVLSPTRAVLLLVPAPFGITLGVVLGLLVAQVGTYALARRLGIGVMGACLAAVAYAFSGPVMVMVHRIDEVYLYPAVLLAVHGAVRGPHRGRWLILLTAVTAGTWFSGFPAGSLFVLYTAAAFALACALSRSGEGGEEDADRRDLRAWVRRIPRIWPAALGMLAGTAVAAFQLLPTYEFLGASGRLDREFSLAHKLGVVKLATAVSGRFFGTYQNRDFWFPGTGLTNPVEANATLGLVVLCALLAIVVGLRGRRVGGDGLLTYFFMPVTLLTGAAMVLGGAALWVIHLLPFMASNSFPRARFIPALCLVLVAGHALEMVRSRRDPDAVRASPWLRGQVAIVVLAVGIGVVKALVVAYRLSREHRSEDAALGSGYADAAGPLALQDVSERALGLAVDLLIPAAIASVAIVAVAVSWRRGVGRPVAAVAILAAAAELQWGAWGFTPSPPPELFYPRHPQFAALEEAAPGGSGRVLPITRTLHPNTSYVFDLREIGAAWPVVERFEDIVYLAAPALKDERTSIFKGNFSVSEIDLSSPALDTIAAIYVTQRPAAPPLQLGPAAAFDVTPADLPARVAIDGPPPTVRAVTIPITPAAGCDTGWIVLQVGDVTSRILARDVADAPVTFPLPDIALDGARPEVEVSATHCDAQIYDGAARVHPPADDSNLRLVSVENWQVYERTTALPRAQLATATEVVTIAGEALDLIASRPAGSPTIVRNPAPVSGRGGDAEITVDEPDRVEVAVDSDGPGLLVLRDVFAPGWSAEVDGQRRTLMRVDYALRGVRVPTGRSTVTFTYRPEGLRLGLGIGALAVVVVALTAWLLGRREDRDVAVDGDGP